MSRKLDAFALLRRLDSGDMGLYASIPKEDKKELEQFLAFPALRWISSAFGEYEELAIEGANELANMNYFSFGKHPQLQCKLLAACGTRRRPRRYWVNAAKKSKKRTAHRDAVLAVYPHLKDDEIDLYLEEWGNEGAIACAMAAGWQQDQVKELHD